MLATVMPSCMMITLGLQGGYKANGDDYTSTLIIGERSLLNIDGNI